MQNWVSEGGGGKTIPQTHRGREGSQSPELLWIGYPKERVSVSVSVPVSVTVSLSVCLYVYMSICLYVYMSICLYVYMSIDSSQSYVIQVRCMYHKSIPLTVDMYLRYVSNICPVYTLLNEYISNSFKVLLVGFKDHTKKGSIGKGE